MGELAYRLHQVDPHLRIIEAHPRDKSHKQKSKKTMNVEEWNAAEGPACPKCGKTDVRFVNGMCRDCYGNKKIKLAKEEASLNSLLKLSKNKKLASDIRDYLINQDDPG